MRSSSASRLRPSGAACDAQKGQTIIRSEEAGEVTTDGDGSTTWVILDPI